MDLPRLMREVTGVLQAEVARNGLTLVAELDPAHLRIEVEDNGIGIAEADQLKLFHQFQQVQTGYAKPHQGTGLGLALTRRLAELQGGSVGVRSTLGVGSVFHLVLPCRSGAGATHVPVAEAPVPPGAKRVLVIEDDGADDVLIKPIRSDDVVAALRRACHNDAPLTVLVLDLLMPDMSGFDVLQALRERPQFARLLVFVWTSMELSPDELTALARSAQAIVGKGQGGIEALLARIRAWHAVQPNNRGVA